MGWSQAWIHEISAGDQAALARDQIFQQGNCPLVVSFGACLQRHPDNKNRFVLGLAQTTQQRYRLFEKRRGAFPISLVSGEPGRAIDNTLARADNSRIGTSMVQREKFIQPETPLVNVSSATPETPQCSTKLQSQRASADVAGPLQRCAHVVVFLFKLLQDGTQFSVRPL